MTENFRKSLLKSKYCWIIHLCTAEDSAGSVFREYWTSNAAMKQSVWLILVIGPAELT